MLRPSLSKIRGELEARTRNLASHRKESETQRADSEKALRRAEQVGAESVRKAEMRRGRKSPFH